MPAIVNRGDGVVYKQLYFPVLRCIILFINCAVVDQPVFTNAASESVRIRAAYFMRNKHRSFRQGNHFLSGNISPKTRNKHNKKITNPLPHPYFICT